MNADTSVFVLPYEQDILAYAAQHIIQRQTLPDLSQCSILLPDLHSARTLRRHLLGAAKENGFPALLGPTISTLHNWLSQHVPLTVPIINTHASRLMLVESLREHPALYGDGGPWALADSLLVLFDELSQQHVHLPPQLDDFTEQLHQAYNAGRNSPIEPKITALLTREATLVHTLWQAWQQQQQQENCTDALGAHIQRLQLSCDQITPEQRLFLIGYDHFTSAEADWLCTLMSRNQAELIVHGNADQATSAQPATDHTDLPHYHSILQRLLRQCQQVATTIPPSADQSYSDFINTAFMPLPRLQPSDNQLLTTNMAARAQRFGKDHPNSPVQQRLRIVTAANPEQQVRAVDVQIRLWLQQGKRNIAIICADLRLSRRLRALLERANIHLRDQNGWTLSTSRAAAVLERLLQTAEEDYDQLPLLDLLRSPFLLPEWAEDDRLRAAYHLEHDIIQHENIARGLQRYRQHISSRQRRLNWPEGRDNPLNHLLDDIETGITPLLPCIRAQSPLPAQQFLTALHQSMTTLGLCDTFASDPAGIRLLEVIQQLHQAVENRSVKMHWLEFRRWLGQALEQAHFLPPGAESPGPSVQLLTLTDTPLQDFDALLFASADQEHLPPASPGTPFFNDSVRHELGLELTRQHHERALSRFRNYLQRAPEIVFSWHTMDNDKSVNPSPWLTLLNTFHKLSYQTSLDDPVLLQISRQAASQVIRCDQFQTAALQTQPAPSAAALLPDTLSATTYQNLINCPYRFFAANCLGLKAEENIQQMMEKSDYGHRVHRILQAFHQDIRNLPGPFTAVINADNRASAQRCLEDISRVIFARDLEDNALHRSWLQQWLQLIPEYLDWQQQRQQQWRPVQFEQQQETTLAGLPGITLKGRLDRIDQATDNNQHHAIIDYKTGYTPARAEVKNGEQVQLPFYALLHAQPLEQVEYLQLGKSNNHARAKTVVQLQGNELALLRDQQATRIAQLFQSLRNHQAMPAWGDQHTCKYCDLDGLCRRQTWEQDMPATVNPRS